ncbi:MAG: alpha/beta hydrolase family esterase [Flavicella sp.]
MVSIKKISILYTLLCFLSSCNSSETEKPTPEIIKGKTTNELMVNGEKRHYISYVPEDYSTENPIPLLLSFHGTSSNMEYNYEYTQFSLLAELEHFIVIHPDGIDNNWIVNHQDNIDIHFIELLLQELQSKYNIDSKRIYCTGMSRGGFFSFNLACRMSDQIAAIASVTGTMYGLGINQCSPSRPVSILQIHGTEDKIVSYETVSNVLSYWIDFNKTDTIPFENDLPNIDTEDGSNVVQYRYTNGTNGVEVQHLKINGGGHEWPGHRGNMDINATSEVWNFLKQFDLDGSIEY